MEILAFLVLGLIAMLAIVPPLVRGRIEESPLDSVRHFRKSMLEMAASVNPSEYSKPSSYGKRKIHSILLFSGAKAQPEHLRRAPQIRKAGSLRSRAAERRMKVYVVLGFLVVVSGIAAIIARTAVLTAVFFIFAGLLLLFFSLVQIMVKRR